MNGKFKGFTLMAGMLLAITGCSSGGDDPAPATQAGSPAAGVSVAADTTTTSAHDLRGLTYARVAPNAGKMYASGHVGTDNPTRQVVVARFNADGSPDATFGGDGFVELEATTGPEESNNDETSIGIAELQSGDVVVTVNAADVGGGQSVYLFRLTPNGDKKAGWGDANGMVEVVFGWANANNGTFPGAPATLPSDTAWDVQVDRSVATDRVVVFGFGSAAGGVRTDNDRYVARLNVTNTGAVADPAFNGGNAFTFFSTGTENDNARRGIVEDDGKIVAAGYTGASSSGIGNTVILFRLNANGTLDNTFGGFSSEPTLVAATPGIAAFNPFKVDGGVAECYAVGRQSTGSYVTTGYGGATSNPAPPAGSTLGYLSTLAQDVVTFRVLGGTATSVDTTWANQGHLAIQSEGKGKPTNEDRGRHLVVLADDRVIEVGRYGGNPAAFVLSANGSSVGIIELPHATINSQFFGAALSEDGSRVAMTTNADATNGPSGARLVVLQVN
jgi:uncharacterized delta-60 repeat protein